MLPMINLLVYHILSPAEQCFKSECMRWFRKVVIEKLFGSICSIEKPFKSNIKLADVMNRSKFIDEDNMTLFLVLIGPAN